MLRLIVKLQEINRHLIEGRIDDNGVLPHLDALKTAKFIFEQDFGLKELPPEPGVIFIRGPRQYGKSTWLEQQLAETIRNFGPGTALYLNGDDIPNVSALLEEIQTLTQLFSAKAPIKRLFIDEITAIPAWEKAVKRAYDQGLLRDVLLISTGSKATDLRRGTERLPGRKGKLARTQYIFTPLSYTAFCQQAQHVPLEERLGMYLLSGGSAMAADALLSTGRLPDYAVNTVNDWIFGEIFAHGRSRAFLLPILQNLYRMAGTPIGQAKLARESGMANNTVVQGYMELLADLMTVIPAFSYDLSKKVTSFRKPCKFHFVNTLAALTWHPARPRTVQDLKNLGSGIGALWEWAVAQEIWRKNCLADPEGISENLYFWQSQHHEIDFVLPKKDIFIEVKSGKEAATNYLWFLKSFPKKQLIVINQTRFDSQHITGITLADFLST